MFLLPNLFPAPFLYMETEAQGESPEVATPGAQCAMINSGPQCPRSQDGCSDYQVSLFLFSSQAANSTPVMHLNRRQDKYQCSQRTPQPCSLPGTHRKRNRPGHFASRSIRAARSDLLHKSHDSLPNTFSPITTRDTRLGTRPTAESVKAARFFWCFEIRRAGLKYMWPYVWPNSGDISSQAFDWAEIPPPAIRWCAIWR